MNAGDFRQQLKTYFSGPQTRRKKPPLTEFLADWLHTFDARITTHTFSPPAPEAIIVALCVILSVSGTVLTLFQLPFIGAAVALLGFWAFFRHFMGMGTPLKWLLPHKSAVNTVGHIPPEKAISEGHVVLLANPARRDYCNLPQVTQQRLRGYFLFFTTVLALMIPWTYLGEYWGRLNGYQNISVILILVQILNLMLYFFYFKPLRSQPGDGTNLMAMEALMSRVTLDPERNYDVYVLCGDEHSTGIGSARSFLKHYTGVLDPDNTLVINFDLQRQGQPAYLVDEGMLVHWRIDEALRNKCATLAGDARFTSLKAKSNKLFLTASLPFVQKNYLCTALVSRVEQNPKQDQDQQSAGFAAELIRDYFR